MQDLLLTLLLGGTVMAVGGGMLVAHRRAWIRLQRSDSATDRDLQHGRTQYRRRMQTSSMVVLLGSLLCFATDQVPWQRMPRLFALYVVVLLLLVLWIVMLAIGDWFAGQVYGRVVLRELERKRQALEQSVAEARRATHAGTPAQSPPLAPEPPGDARLNGQAH